MPSFFMQLFFFRMHYLFGMHMRVLEGRLIKHLSRGIQSTKNPSERKKWISQILRAHRRYGRIHRSHKENQVLFQKVWQETNVPEGHAQGDRRIVIEGLFHSTLLQKHSVLSFAGSCTRQHHRTLVSSDRSPGSREDVFQQLP